MIKDITLHISPHELKDESLLKKEIVKNFGLHENDSLYFEKIKQSIDARSKKIIYVVKLRCYINEVKQEREKPFFAFQEVTTKPEVHIIGAGPAGLFCALQCIQLGIKPILIERGKKVRDRRRDLALLNKEGLLNAESNYCFGEGGAGTYSDGKLYTRSNKRGNIENILHMFHYFGASPSIMYEAHPHIGTNKLPQIIEAMRTKIIECGGIIHFETKLTDILIKNNEVCGIQINNTYILDTKNIVLATGHSARDIYTLLQYKKIEIESKPFALGVRIEHPQELINNIQYRGNTSKDLPPASYSLVQQVQGCGVFSFCMCPGGIIAPASTEHGGVVVNGWSPSKRNNAFANSGMVVSVDDVDFEPFASYNELKAMQYQKEIEQQCYVAGGSNYCAPAQRLVDFTNNKLSTSLPTNSYLRGTTSVNLQEVLPQKIATNLSYALQQFGKKYKGYYTNDAIVVATESRTSSPVKIPRKEDMQHVRVGGLYPCAEGAGYAGGIVSAAMDGIRVANALSQKLKNK